MSEFRYAVFGCGRIGRVHAALVRDQGCSVVAVGDEAPAAAELARVEADLPAGAVFDDAATMAAAIADRVDGVIVASHTRDHARHAAAFLDHGLSVYLEKPISEDLDAAFAFVNSLPAPGPGVPGVQHGLQRRFDPALALARTIIADGTIGEVREIRSALRDQFPPPASFKSPGLIVDMGIHLTDEVRFLIDEFPVEVWADLHHTAGSVEGGDTAFVTMTFESGVVGRLDLSRTHSSGYNNETYVIGTKGTLHVGRFAGYPGPIPVEVWTSAGELHPVSTSFSMADRGDDRPEFLPRFDQAYRLAHADFRAALAEGRPFGVSTLDALDAQVMVEAAQRSALAGRQSVALQRSEDPAVYRSYCVDAGLIPA